MGEKTLFAELQRSMFGGFLNVIEYWKQRRLVLSEPALIFDDPESRLAIKPLAFGIRGLVLLTILFAITNWCIETFIGLPPTLLDRKIAASKALEQKIAGKEQLELQELMEAMRTAPSKNLIQEKKVSALGGTLQPFVIPIGLTLTAYLFARRLRKFQDQAPKVKHSDRAYLYWITSRLFFPNIILATSLQTIPIVERFMPLDSAESLELLQLPLLAICGIWGLVVLRRAAPELALLLGLTGPLGTKKALVTTANALVMVATAINIALLLVMSGILAGYATWLSSAQG